MSTQTEKKSVQSRSAKLQVCDTKVETTRAITLAPAKLVAIEQLGRGGYSSEDMADIINIETYSKYVYTTKRERQSDEDLNKRIRNRHVRMCIKKMWFSFFKPDNDATAFVIRGAIRLGLGTSFMGHARPNRIIGTIMVEKKRLTPGEFPGAPDSVITLWYTSGPYKTKDRFYYIDAIDSIIGVKTCATTNIENLKLSYEARGYVAIKSTIRNKWLLYKPSK